MTLRQRQTGRPEGTLGVHTTAVLRAVMLLHEQRQTPTLRRLQQHTGLAFSSVRYHLILLSDHGLVSWHPRSHATLHPLVRATAP